MPRVPFPVPARTADHAAALDRLTRDPRYLRNIAWGVPRAGHPEGSIQAHIAALEANLSGLRSRLSSVEKARLCLLIHAHDTMKPEATEGTPVGHPRNHATLGADFLAEFIDDPPLVEMARLHDEPYAIWRRHKSGRGIDSARLDRLLAHRWDWDLYAAFLLIDGHTEGKSHSPLRWFFKILSSRDLLARFGPEDVP